MASSPENLSRSYSVPIKLRPRLSTGSMSRKIGETSKITTEEFANRITCHGLPDFYKSKSRASALFWGSILAVATAVLVHSIFSCFQEFYINPIQTTIHITPKRSMTFPKILICPSNFVNHSKPFNHETKQLVDYFSSAKSGDGILGFDNKVSDIFHRLPQLRARTRPAPGLLPVIKTQYLSILGTSMDAEKLIPECKFGAESCQNKITKILDKDFGVCYLVDVKDEQTIPNKGLRLVIDIHSDLMEPEEPQLSDGVTLQIMDEYDPVFYGGVLVSPGRRSQIRLRAKHHRFISVSIFSKSPQVCVSEGEVDLQIVNSTYSREACRLDCIQQAVLYKFKCILPLNLSSIKDPYYSEVAERLVHEEVNYASKNGSINPIRINQITTKYYMNFTKFCYIVSVVEKINVTQFLECGAKCQRACEQRDFDLELSFHKIPSVQMLKKYNKQILRHKSREAASGNSKEDNQTDTAANDPSLPEDAAGEKTGWGSFAYAEGMEPWKNISRWAENIIVLDVAFTSLELTSVVQSPAMTLNTLLSNLGGACGLWLGASCITILQFLVFLVQFCITKCCSDAGEVSVLDVHEIKELMKS